eukprot:CAMPEP_0197184958 /NCGR_PEP_ID=MMETSP1423-20130617/10949_1 /TAXON_ID=476441 /ORGANISM="Pseudo-nitzschia heimii, Strain UNC1101" /LENGTH=453 /DNA_ID=CAMNT_0042635911 /DNA_START=115 /DNA_END=1476 /DNA_ORIENTATION=+
MAMVLLLPCMKGTSAFSCTLMALSRSDSITSTFLKSSNRVQEKDESTNIGTKIRAAVYQPPITIRNNEKFSNEENPLTVMTKITDVLQLASRCSIDVVQFPELFLNGGLFWNVISGRSAPMDRESYALNIIENICADLNIACIVGYAEAKHESERSRSRSSGCYSSLAIFHADGSRAGNYRCVHPLCDPSRETKADIAFEKGHPLVEITPISLKLPERDPAPTFPESTTVKQDTAAKATTRIPREIKLGVMCGGDIMVPEHARHLARLGATIFAVSGCLFDEERNHNANSRLAQHVVPTRCMENEVPLLFSNFVDNDEHGNELSFIGQSTIVSSDGIELVRAPKSLNADMPSDKGYFLPCETGGALYAADFDIGADNNRNRKGTVDTSINEWDIAPRLNQVDNIKKGTAKSNRKGSKKGFQKEKRRKTKGFGKEVMKVLEQNEHSTQQFENKK